jgi:hypothetical protein
MVKYNFQYAKVPTSVAETLNLGYRRQIDGFIIINQNEAHALEGDSFEDKVNRAGGEIITDKEGKKTLQKFTKAAVEKKEILSKNETKESKSETKIKKEDTNERNKRNYKR